MNRTRFIALSFIAAAAVAFGTAAPAFADDVDGVGSFDGALDGTSPDPIEVTYPGYWEVGGHAGGTGNDSENSSPGYTLGGEHAGGTGNEPQDDFPGYSQGGESAGAF